MQPVESSGCLAESANHRKINRLILTISNPRRNTASDIFLPKNRQSLGAGLLRIQICNSKQKSEFRRD